MIYLLQSSSYDFLPDEPHNVGEAPRCKACQGFVGMLQWLPPFRAELYVRAATFGDIAFGVGDSLLVSERFASLWRSEGLTGLGGFEPVEVTTVRHRAMIQGEPPPYFRVSVVRSAVALDQKASGIKWGKPPTCHVCRIGDDLRGWSKVVLEASPSENVFIARGLPGKIIADDRFRLFCEKHRLENGDLIPGPDAAHWF